MQRRLYQGVLTVIALRWCVGSRRSSSWARRRARPEVRAQFGSEARRRVRAALAAAGETGAQHRGHALRGQHERKHRNDVRFLARRLGRRVVLVDADAGGVMGARSESAISSRPSSRTRSEGHDC